MKNKKLHNIKTTGYKTPDNYFESFEDKLFERLSEEKKLQGLKSPGYSVPKDYFNNIEDKVLRRLENEEKPIVRLQSRKIFYYVAGIAASIIMLFAIFVNTESTQDFSVEMVETYFENSDLDSYEIAQLLLDADMLEDDFLIIETTYNESNLENYLLNNADIETILE